jgi:hypothetical protein
MNIFRSLFREGGDRNDGSTPEKAIVVGSVAEEYAWMRSNCRGWQPDVQFVEEIDGKDYDVHRLSNSRGESRTLYFDISSFYGKY